MGEVGRPQRVVGVGKRVAKKLVEGGKQAAFAYIPLPVTIISTGGQNPLHSSGAVVDVGGKGELGAVGGGEAGAVAFRTAVKSQIEQIRRPTKLPVQPADVAIGIPHGIFHACWVGLRQPVGAVFQQRQQQTGANAVALGHQIHNRGAGKGLPFNHFFIMQQIAAVDAGDGGGVKSGQGGAKHQFAVGDELEAGGGEARLPRHEKLLPHVNHIGVGDLVGRHQ